MGLAAMIGLLALGMTVYFNAIPRIAARSPAGTMAMIAGLVVWHAFLLACIVPFNRWFWLPVIARSVAGLGFCAACGYPLGGVAAAEDGCTVCPECGAAWRLTETESPA